MNNFNSDYQSRLSIQLSIIMNVFLKLILNKRIIDYKPESNCDFHNKSVYDISYSINEISFYSYIKTFSYEI